MAVISLTADLLDLLLSTHLLNSIKSDSFSGVSGLKFNNPGHVWKAFVEDVEYDEQRVLNSYHNSLFNCCLVSKSWYRSSVKSLWREPLFRDDHIATRFLSLPGDHRYFLSSLVKSLRVREFPFQRQTFQPITTNTLIRLIKETSETLRQLVIGPGTYRTKLNDGFFKDLLKISLPNLEDFSIFNGGCSGMSSTQFIETCCSDHSRSGERGMLFSKPLKSISLIDCGWLGDAVLTELVLSTYRSSLSSATTLDQLVHLELDLSYMNADQGLDVLVELLVKDNGVDGGGGRCRLESLALPWIDLVGDDQDVHHHIEITPETTEYIPPFIRLIKCMGQTLKSLSLAHANLKPDTLLQLSHWCPKLTILDLGQCGNLCDAMVESMTAFQLSIEFLGRITHLSVSACPLSKHGLQLLILHCQRLIYLDISLFPLSVTDDLIYFMSRHSHSLEVVNLDHCSGVSAAALVWLVIRLKRLEFICLSPVSSDVVG